MVLLRAMLTSYDFVIHFSVVIYFFKYTAGVNYGVYRDNSSEEKHAFYKNVEYEFAQMTSTSPVVTTLFGYIDPGTIKELKLENVYQYFEIFKRFYNRLYYQVSDKEEEYRKRIFTVNLQTLLRIRDAIPTANFLINQYLDFTLEEFHLHFTGFNANGLTYENVQKFTHSTDPPENLDWSAADLNFLPRHQGNCKGSYIFSALANIEIQEMRVYGKTYGYYSVLEGYDCEMYGSCAYGGLPHLVLETLKHLGGVAKDETAGDPRLLYKMRAKGHCQYWMGRKKYLNVTAVVRFKVDHEDELAAAVYELGPVTTAIYVSEALKNYRSGILIDVNCAKKPNHAVVIVGYGTDKDNTPYWILRNSWGPDWGQNGHFFIRRGMGMCGFGEYLVTVMVERIATSTAEVNHNSIPAAERPKKTSNIFSSHSQHTTVSENRPLQGTEDVLYSFSTPLSETKSALTAADVKFSSLDKVSSVSKTTYASHTSQSVSTLPLSISSSK